MGDQLTCGSCGHLVTPGWTIICDSCRMPLASADDGSSGDPQTLDLGEPSSAMEPTDPAIHLRWEIDLGSGPIHVVELIPGELTPGRSFRCDGIEYKIGHLLGLGPRVTEFHIDHHPATMTMRFRTRGRGQAIGLILAGVHGAASLVGWSIYELTVDGRSQGGFIATSVGAEVRGWARVQRDDPLLHA